MEVSPFYRIKVLFVGSSNAGKSSLVYLVHNDELSQTPSPTIGMAFVSTNLELEEYPLSNPSKLPYFYREAKTEFGVKEENNNQLVKVQIWDSSGQQRFSSVMPVFMRDIDICFLVFDLTNRESWDRLPALKEQVSSYSKFSTIPLFVLVGTKSDLKDHQISLAEVKERAEIWGIKYYILSAVQDSSASMLRRMIYVSVQNYHDMLLLLTHENKPLPVNVTSSKMSRKSSFVDFNTDSEKTYCCSIS